MHIFLTGAVQVGKSTVVGRVMAGAGRPLGGFRTCFGPDRGAPDRLLYLCGADGPPLLDEAHGVVRYRAGTPFPIPGRFDALGAPLLRDARARAGLIIMDECGRLERDAAVFQAEILRTLDGGVPVLGVLREGFPGWTGRVAAHPAVRVLTVTRDNRDSLPRALLDRLGPDGWGA